MEDDIDYVADKKKARHAKKAAQKSSSVQIGEGFVSSSKVLDVMEVEKIAKHVTKAAKLKEDDLRKVFAENFLAIVKHDR